MKRYLIVICILISCSSSNDGPKLTFEKKLSKMTTKEVNARYETICSNLETSRKKFGKELDGCPTSEQKKTVYKKARALLIKTLSDSMFVCWYGTEWDFNGTTTKPRDGTIACGYFVTTVIEDAGFKIPRVGLAQCASQSMINTLCPKADRKIITNNNVAGVRAHLLSKPDGIFILGLDNHTGFVVKKDTSLRFVHSNYTMVEDGVMSEPFDESSVIQNNGYFAVGNFLQSDSTIIKWIKGISYDE